MSSHSYLSPEDAVKFFQIKDQIADLYEQEMAILIRYDWRVMADNGAVVPAIRAYHRKFDVRLKEAKDVVEDYIRSRECQSLLSELGLLS